MGMMGWTHESLKKYVIIAKHNYDNSSSSDKAKTYCM